MYEYVDIFTTADRLILNMKIMAKPNKSICAACIKKINKIIQYLLKL